MAIAEHLVLSTDQSSLLTDREQEVLKLLGEGLASKEIATKLDISKRTVDFHLANIYSKLKTDNRVQACRRAMILGILTI